MFVFVHRDLAIWVNVNFLFRLVQKPRGLRPGTSHVVMSKQERRHANVCECLQF